jgi:hypothetical protein
MKAAIGFEVACHVGNDLIAGGEHAPARNLEASVGLRAGDCRIYPFVQYADPRTHFRRVQTALPLRGGVAPVGRLECQQVDAVARPQARRVIENRDKFGVKSHIHAHGVIVELEIRQQRHLWKHILDEQCFAPTAVSYDQIRLKTF